MNDRVALLDKDGRHLKTVSLVNLTPHWINVYQKGKKVLHIPPSGETARVVFDMEITGYVRHIGIVPIKDTKKKVIVGLPSKKHGTMYIVSGQVINALEGSRDDCVMPNTQEPVKNRIGKVIGVKSFLR